MPAQVGLRDLEVYDPVMFKNLQRLMGLPGAENWAHLDFQDLTGSCMPVSDDNKHQFVQLQVLPLPSPRPTPRPPHRC